jgi:hypothetical protein
MKDLSRQHTIVIVRALAGIALYSVFWILSLVADLTHTRSDHVLTVGILLVLSFVVFPRRATPRDVDIDEPEEVSDEDRALWERLERMDRWLLWTRVIFFVGALVTLVVLPELL